MSIGLPWLDEEDAKPVPVQAHADFLASEVSEKQVKELCSKMDREPNSFGGGRIGYIHRGWHIPEGVQHAREFLDRVQELTGEQGWTVVVSAQGEDGEYVIGSNEHIQQALRELGM